MEPHGRSPDSYRSPAAGGSNGGFWRRHMLQFSASNLIHAPLSTLLEYSGILRPRSSHQEDEGLIAAGSQGQVLGRREDPSASQVGGGEVSIRIIGAGDDIRGPLHSESIPADQIPVVSDRQDGDGGNEGRAGEVASASNSLLPSISAVGAQSMDSEANVTGGNARDLPRQSEIQQVMRWLEQILPFSLLLLVVFIRQHLQGFFVTIWIAAVMFKSNDILRKQTALKGERRIYVLLGIMLIFVLHVVGVYWGCGNDDLFFPLFLRPPTEIPPFWHAIFIIMVNDTLVRQAVMVFKCVLLMYYRNSMGRSYRKQGQMLTLVEYLLLLYRALLPTPVWYRFFLNNEYGSFFSSLTAGIYLTFKLTSLVKKVQSFFAALKGLSCNEMHYGSYATIEQVTTAGDLCTICQEKLHAPILLRCKHIFCEDCVSEWFERERTCPLCRALVKPAGLRSFGDGSTTMFFQLF